MELRLSKVAERHDMLEVRGHRLGEELLKELLLVAEDPKVGHHDGRLERLRRDGAERRAVATKRLLARLVCPLVCPRALSAPNIGGGHPLHL
eukprot:scaffold4656_cov29-Tisochrysis_lutea.AAC.1